ncbi:SDR family NAD(P)-dependent oxidoreductase [Mycobacterium tilburgii]|uniref:SDR family NAD(P)-dependent oxidoreductase n=1 Tax=Mycobacterium tilburgii TaxID=44467 RepID=UPI003899414C
MAADGAAIMPSTCARRSPASPNQLATPEDLTATVKLVEDTGARIVAKQGDVRDRAALTAAVQAGVDEFGRLDIVVASAGIAPMQSGDDGWHGRHRRQLHRRLQHH